MASQKPLSTSVLIALGFASTGCPTLCVCLNYAAPDEIREDLEDQDPNNDAGVKTCLSLETNPDVDAPEAKESTEARDQAVDGVLKRGVLPEDVELILKKRKESQSKE